MLTRCIYKFSCLAQILKQYWRTRIARHGCKCSKNLRPSLLEPLCMRWLCLVSSTSAFSPSIFVSRLPAHLLNCFFNSGLFTSWSNIHWLMWPGFIVTRALRSGTHLSVIMSMHPNTRLDLSAMYYTNMWCFPQ